MFFTCGVYFLHVLSDIHILPAFERVGEQAFNRKVKEFNDEIKVFCEKKSKCSFIENGIIYGYKTNMYSDGIHFSALGQKNLVKILKTHLNTRLGLKPYSEYQSLHTNRRRQYPHQQQTYTNSQQGTRYLNYNRQQQYPGYNRQKYSDFNQQHNQVNQLIQRLLQIA